MIKNYLTLIVVLFFLFPVDTRSATWEKLYEQESTDCFRSVREVPSGGFILAGYTANFTPNDTDGLVIRMDDNGDILWTFIYNGPNSKEDCFYKVLPTSDGGFVLCGYSRSFGSGDNAFYLKLSSSGNQQWVKNWGGSGIERAQDIVELSNGKFVICGYTTTSPARYYDAFILKISSSGNTEWSNIFGGTSYDDANSLIELSDGGFLLGGQSNSDLYLVRTDSNGDSLWTKKFGTSGIDNIESINFAQGGNGFVLAGTTDGPGAGGEDGYLVKTDTGGVQVWAKTYGGNLNDGFHRVEKTNDGGYFAMGTSSEGPWGDPNIWITKLDGSGNQSWENFFGGNNHDHGYSGQPTSDGGYIAAGHTHSFANNNFNEDAMVIKTNSSGNVSNKLTYTTVTDLISPVTAACGSANVQVEVEITNYSDETVSNIPVTVEITGAITQTLTQTYNSSVIRDQSKTLVFNTTIDMSMGGTFNFHCFTGNPHDVYPDRNFLDKTINAGVTSQPPSVTAGTHCGPSTVDLSASSPDPLKWYSAASGGSSLGTGATFTTPFITSTTVFYAQAGTACPSTRVPVNATITPGLTDPTGTDASRCGSGTVTLAASSVYTIKWYDTSTSLAVLTTGNSFTTPTLNSNSTYYIAAENASCNSNRIPVHAVINQLPGNPVAVPGTTCGSGTVLLAVTASSPVKWYDASSGGTQVGSGTIFNTPFLNTSKTYYAQADDGTCLSSRIPVLATIATIPTAPVAASTDRCGTGTLILSASASNPIKWFDALSGGNQVGSGGTFTTPVLSATTTYYVLTDNGQCSSVRIPVDAIVHSLPADPSTTSDSRCGAGTLLLTALAADPILWFDAAIGGNQVGFGNNFTTPALSSTTIYYAQADNGQCGSNRISANATVFQIPVINLGPDTVYSSASTYLLDAGTGFTGYFWAPSFLSQTYTVNNTGNYCVTVTDINNCTATECIFVDLPLGINDNIAGNKFSLYPDPSHGLVTIELSDIRLQNYLTVLDITGKIVFSEALYSDKKIIDFSFLTSGIYFMRITGDETVSTRRFVIE